MADDDTQPQPAAPAPGSMSGYLSDPTVQALLRQITNPSPPQLPAPPARVSSDGTRPGWLSLLGEGLGGGQSPLYHLSGSAEDAAGSRSLLNFGIGMLMASGPQRVRPGLGQIFGSGLQAAQESMDASQKAAFTQAGQQFQQQKDLASLGIEQQKAKIEQLSAILPLLKLNALQNQPPLYGDGSGTGSQPAGGGFTGDMAHDLALAKQHESGGDYNAMNYVAKADPSAWDRGATATGAYQMIQGTWDEGKKLAGIDPGKYGRAMDAPPAVQDQVAQAIYAKHGYAPWDASKFGANWVLGSDGRYQLVKGAQPGSRTGAPLQPGSTQVAAAPAPAAPVAPAAPSGVQLGGAPPAPPGGAPGAATGAPAGFGAALNPPAPVATAPGQPRADIAPTTPEGRLAALTGGMKLAQADMAPPGTVMAAGPAAGTPPTAVATRGGGPASYAPPPANLPAGNYNNAPAAPAQPPQQPAAPVVPPTAPPVRDTKAQGPDGSFTVPDEKLSVPEFQDRYRKTYSPEELRARGIVMPDNPQALQTAYAGVQQAEADARAARQAAQTAYSMSGDAGRGAMAAVNEADKNAQDARQKYTDLIQGTNKDNATALAKLYSEQDAQLANDRKDLLDRIQKGTLQTQAEKAAADLKTQEGQQGIALERAKGQTASEQKVMDSLNETQESARTALDQVNLARQFSQASGDPGFWQLVQKSHPDFVQWAANTGAIPADQVQKLANTGAMDAAVNKLISMARTGSGFQRMTNLDVQILSSQAPEGTDPQTWRDAKLAYLQTYMQHQMDYVDDVHSRVASGDKLYDAQKNARTAQSDIVPQMDAKTAGDPAARTAWAQRNVPPNTFFRAPDGQLVIYPGR